VNFIGIFKPTEPHSHSPRDAS